MIAIVLFGNDVRDRVVRSARYLGVARRQYDPKGDLSSTLRSVLGQAKHAIRKFRGAWPESVVILAASGQGVAKVSAALSNGSKPLRHKVAFDEAAVLLAARIGAFLLEPKEAGRDAEDTAEALRLAADLRRAEGTKGGAAEATRMLADAEAVLGGRHPRSKHVGAMRELVQQSRESAWTGDPGPDWLRARALLRGSSHSATAAAASHLDYLVAFNRGRRIASGLSSAWLAGGTYSGARRILNSALAEEQILGGLDDLRGLHVMTIHKSKGKQFDCVILLREGRPGPTWESSFVWRDDMPPYPRSRRILRVGITRARSQVVILDPTYPRCPIIGPYW